MKVKLSEIKVGERFRKKFEDMDKLKESIRMYGLIEPIVVDENNELIAGERRFRAHLELKIPEIEVKHMKDLTELEKKEVELEENIQRKGFTWQEEVTAKQQLHVLKQKIHGSAVKGHDSKGWGMKQTADALGESLGTVGMDIQLARGMRAFPELLKETSKASAQKKLKMLQARVMNEALASKLKEKGLLDVPNIINGNCLSEMAKMEAGSVDMILTDPPYGIQIGNAHTYGRMTIADTYADEDFTTFDMLDKVFAQMFRVLADDKHAIVFCGIDKYIQVRNLLIKHGFWVHHLPIIWDKGSGSYPSQSTTFVHSYEVCLHARKGNRKINGTPRDVFNTKRVPPNRKIHPSEKPAELIRDLINWLSLPGEIVLDCFAGSGVVGEAAKDTNRRCILIELDPKFHMGIVARLSKKEE